MSTTISVLGGVGLFLLGMTVMTGGLKALAGSALRSVLSGDTLTRLFLGRGSHTSGAVVQRNDNDDHWSRQCGPANFSSRVRPRSWRERWHDRNRMACRTHRRPGVTHRCRTANDLRRRVDQASR